MTTLSNVQAIINDGRLATNVSGDVNATDVRGVLNDTFTETINGTTATIPTPGQIGTLALAAAQGVVSAQANLAQVRAGQTVKANPVGKFSGPGYRDDGPIGFAQLDKALSYNNSVQDAGGWALTEYFTVTPGGSLTVGAYGNNTTALAFYTADKTYISEVDGPFTDGQVISVPANAVLARTSVAYDKLDSQVAIHKFQILEGTVSPMPHSYRTMPAYVSMFRPWHDRVWSIHGDSMAASRAGNFWFSDAAQYHGCRYAKNQARDGGTASTLLRDISAAGDLPSTFWNDVDCVFSITGQNDVSVGVTVGTIDDATSATTFYGYYKKFIETILTNNPYVRMVLMTPINRPSDTTTFETSLEALRVAVRTLGKHYGIKVWDIGMESQVNAITMNAYLEDGIHPAYHTGDLVTGTWRPKDVGSLLVFGSQLRGLMHQVMPVDFRGDPQWTAAYQNYTIPYI